ncbi:hypothetical protein [Bacillus sp. CDB3]|uniref:hypothetical protein n=1 Tax=Bacillus sp. CDB3 TaxID=360310 RepID=UPI0015C4E4F3|nr:hypothetical protein [Bacillus sp. CDB3]
MNTNSDAKKMQRISKQIKFPAELVQNVERYQMENNLSSFSAAVYELIRKGLKKE